MKSALLITLGVVAFMALPSVMVWKAVEKERRVNVNYSPGAEDSDAPSIETVFADQQEDDNASQGVDAATEKTIEELLISLGKAGREGDGAALARHFSMSRILLTAEQSGVLSLPSGSQRAQFYADNAAGLRYGLAGWADALAWDVVDIRRIDRINDKEVIVYARLWDDQLEIYSKMRWWMVHSKSKGWLMYDYEDLDSNLRMSTLLGLALAPDGQLRPWLLELSDGIDILTDYYTLSDTGYTDTTDLEEFARGFLEHSLPPKIEGFGRLLLATALIGQESYEEALAEIVAIEESDNAGEMRSPMLSYFRGICLGALQRYEEALASYEEYAEIFGWDADVLEMVADTYLALDQPEKAIDAAERGLTDMPRSTGCFATLAVVLPKDRRHELLKHAENPETPEEAWELAVDYALEMNRPEVADGLFEIFRELYPENEAIEYYIDYEDLGTGIDVTRWSLDDWLDDAEVREQVDEHHRRSTRFVELVGNALGENDLAKLLDYLIVDPQNRTLKRILSAQGDSAHPALIAALDDPRFVEPVDVEIEYDSDTENSYQVYPLSVVIRLFDDKAPAEAVPALLRLLEKGSTKNRAAAGRALAACGHDKEDLAKSLLATLKSGPDEMRKGIYEGLRIAAREERLSPRLAEEVLPLLRKRIESGSRTDNEIWTLQAMDKAGAIAFFQSDKVLRADHASLYQLLWALQSEDVEIDAGKLLRFLDVHYPKANQAAASTPEDAGYVSYPSADVVRSVIRELAARGHPRVEKWAEKMVDHENATVRGAGADALCELAGLNDFGHYELQEQTSDATVTKLLERLKLVDWLSEEVSDIGLVYYIENNEPKDVLATVDALGLVGATESRDLLRKAIDLFGADGLPDNREQVDTAIDALLERDDEIFDDIEVALDERYNQRYALSQLHLLQFKDLLLKDARKHGLIE